MSDTPRIEELKRRVQSDPASIAFAALAEEYRRAGRFEEAIAACTAGLVRHPAYLSAHVTLGRALLEVGRFEDAREELEHVLRLAPENLAAIRGLAEIHHRRGDDTHEHYSDADVARYAAEGDAAHAAEAALRQAATHASAAAPDIALPPAAAPAAAVEVHAPVASTAAHAAPVAAAHVAPAAAPAQVAPAAAATHAPAAVRSAGPPPSPALAGLEQFLHAIVRARSEPASAR
jgi:tetratricopeptide (TPR) repeat protein